MNISSGFCISENDMRCSSSLVVLTPNLSEIVVKSLKSCGKNSGRKIEIWNVMKKLHFLSHSPKYTIIMFFPK